MVLFSLGYEDVDQSPAVRRGGREYCQMPKRYRDMTPGRSAALPSSSSQQVVEWAQPEPEAIGARCVCVRGVSLSDLLPQFAQRQLYSEFAMKLGISKKGGMLVQEDGARFPDAAHTITDSEAEVEIEQELDDGTQEFDDAAFGFNMFDMLVVDLMHEVELGVWKAVFIHLLRLLDCHGECLKHELDWWQALVESLDT